MSTERIERIRAEEARVGDRIKAPEGHAFYELTVAHEKPGLEPGEDKVELGTGWGSVVLEPGEIVERENWEVGDAAAEIAKNMRARLDRFLALECASNDPAEQAQEGIEKLDLGAEYDDHELKNEGEVMEAAQEALNAFPLAVERMVSFEVVFGTGGPDDRLIVECSVAERHGDPTRDYDYEIRHVLYRYSWTGSAEVPLIGEDKEIGEAIARRYVPELAE